MTTRNAVTDTQIKALQQEAALSGDNATLAATFVALGVTPSEMPEHIRQDQDPAVRHWTAGVGDIAHARVCCADVIAEAQAQDE